MPYLARLQAATTLHDTAHLLGTKPSVLAYWLYALQSQNKYTIFRIPKKSGGERTISAPIGPLKLIQVRLAKLLVECQLEIDTNLKIKQRCVLAHGFKSGFSITTNAVNHRNRRWVFNTDLQDFFPSINFGRVRGFFIKNQHYQLHRRTATIIAQIACHNIQLPQGSPSSPVISNIIANILDVRLNELATARGCTYTRYADDLTFSTNKKDFPHRIATRDPTNHDRWTAGDDLMRRIAKQGFAVNGNKSRMQYRASRQDATGLVINKKVNVRKEYYKLARAMCWQLVTKGAAFEKVNGNKIPMKLEKLHGMLAFIYHVKKWDDLRRGIPHEETQESCFYSVYADYLNYVSFFVLTQPTIVCEGKTDTVYLRCAIRALSTQYPTLTTTVGAKKTLQVRLFKFTKTTASVQGLSGGADQLSKVLSNYRKMIQNFKGTPRHPTILIVDNDSGPAKLFKHLSNLLKKPIDGSDPYYFVYENLYVVPVPKVGKKFTAMEQLFDPKVLQIERNGRKLDLSNKETDGKKFYSKNEFSVEVIRKGQAKINFDGFRPLLDAIAAVQKDYASRSAKSAGTGATLPVAAAPTTGP